MWLCDRSHHGHWFGAAWNHPAENRSEKEKTYDACRQFMREFEALNGSTLCLALLECDISTPEGLAGARQKGLFRSRCSKFVRDAVEVVQGIKPGYEAYDDRA
jgi:hypothetical protein